MTCSQNQEVTQFSEYFYHLAHRSRSEQELGKKNCNKSRKNLRKTSVQRGAELQCFIKIENWTPFYQLLTYRLTFFALWFHSSCKRLWTAGCNLCHEVCLGELGEKIESLFAGEGRPRSRNLPLRFQGWGLDRSGLFVAPAYRRKNRWWRNSDAVIHRMASRFLRNNFEDRSIGIRASLDTDTWNGQESRWIMVAYTALAFLHHELLCCLLQREHTVIV